MNGRNIVTILFETDTFDKITNIYRDEFSIFITSLECFRIIDIYKVGTSDRMHQFQLWWMLMVWYDS